MWLGRRSAGTAADHLHNAQQRIIGRSALGPLHGCRVLEVGVRSDGHAIGVDCLTRGPQGYGVLELVRRKKPAAQPYEALPQLPPARLPTEKTASRLNVASKEKLSYCCMAWVLHAMTVVTSSNVPPAVQPSARVDAGGNGDAGIDAGCGVR